MKNLEQEQKEMRERNERKKAKEDPIEKKPIRAGNRTDELDILRKRVSAFERENAELRREIAALRQYPAPREKSYEQQCREQQHNYFKYSNIRRY